MYFVESTRSFAIEMGQTMGVLLYDPQCNLCVRSARLAQRLQLGAAIEPGWNEELLVHGVDFGRFKHAIPYVLDNRQVAYGVVGIALALKTSQITTVRWVAKLLLFPGLRKIAETVYAAVADHRSGRCSA